MPFGMMQGHQVNPSAVSRFSGNNLYQSPNRPQSGYAQMRGGSADPWGFAPPDQRSGVADVGPARQPIFQQVAAGQPMQMGPGNPAGEPPPRGGMPNQGVPGTDTWSGGYYMGGPIDATGGQWGPGGPPDRNAMQPTGGQQPQLQRTQDGMARLPESGQQYMDNLRDSYGPASSAYRPQMPSGSPVSNPQDFLNQRIPNAGGQPPVNPRSGSPGNTFMPSQAGMPPALQAAADQYQQTGQKPAGGMAELIQTPGVQEYMQSRPRPEAVPMGGQQPQLAPTPVSGMMAQAPPPSSHQPRRDGYAGGQPSQQQLAQGSANLSNQRQQHIAQQVAQMRQRSGYGQAPPNPMQQARQNFLDQRQGAWQADGQQGVQGLHQNMMQQIAQQRPGYGMTPDQIAAHNQQNRIDRGPQGIGGMTTADRLQHNANVPAALAANNQRLQEMIAGGKTDTIYDNAANRFGITPTEVMNLGQGGGRQLMQQQAQQRAQQQIQARQAEQQGWIDQARAGGEQYNATFSPSYHNVNQPVQPIQNTLFGTNYGNRAAGTGLPQFSQKNFRNSSNPWNSARIQTNAFGG